MPLFRKYLKTQFKRGFCILPSIFFSFALFLICLGIPYLFLLSRFNPNLSGNQKIRIAIIGDKSNPYFDFMVLSEEINILRMAPQSFCNAL